MNFAVLCIYWPYGLTRYLSLAQSCTLPSTGPMRIGPWPILNRSSGEQEHCICCVNKQLSKHFDHSRLSAFLENQFFAFIYSSLPPASVRICNILKSRLESEKLFAAAFKYAEILIYSPSNTNFTTSIRFADSIAIRKLETGVAFQTRLRDIFTSIGRIEIEYSWPARNRAGVASNGRVASKQ